MKLNAKQKLFVKEYLIDKNASRAARAAGYSEKSSASIGEENLRKPDIAAAVDKGLAKLAQKADISAERVTKELAEIAFIEMNKAELKKSSGNKLRALELLGKKFGMFTDNIDLVAKLGLTGKVNVNLTMPANGSEAPPPAPAVDKKENAGS